jgi:LPXTG-motif cell wall-anchored protein
MEFATDNTDPNYAPDTINPDFSAEDISCTSTGDCTAVGLYRNGNTIDFGYSWTSTDGIWAPAQPMQFANDLAGYVEGVHVYTVSCSSPGFCTAGGSYDDSNGRYPFTVTSSNGAWADIKPVEFAFPTTGDDGYVNSVSCSGDGNCTAVGAVATADGNKAFTMTSTTGTWGQAQPVTFESSIDPDTDADLEHLECTAADSCTAVGRFQTSNGGNEGFMMTHSNGTWGPATSLVFGANVNNVKPATEFSDLFCTSAGNCTAVGQFKNADGLVQPFTVASTNGTWGQAQLVQFVDGVTQFSPQSSRLSSVSCAAAGNCTAVGQFKNAGGQFEAFTVTSSTAEIATTSTGGTWGQAQLVQFVDGVTQSDPRKSALYYVSCTSDGYCVAAGTFRNAGGGTETFTVLFYNPPPPPTDPGDSTNPGDWSDYELPTASESLPDTGSNVEGMVLGALTLVCAGVLLARTRRRTTT